MKPSLRADRIVEIVNTLGRCTVQELATKLDMSQETVRRDLAKLTTSGRLRKFHGGAARLEPDSESPFDQRADEDRQEKIAIARVAATCFTSGDSLFIDAGTTTTAFAHAMATAQITAITNSLRIADILGQSGRNSVFLLGGKFRRDGMENLGAFTVQQIAQFRPSDVVLTVGAIDESGIMDYDMEEAEIAKAMLASGARLTVLAASRKFRRQALFHICPLDRIDRLIVDLPPADPLYEKLKALGIELLVA